MARGFANGHSNFLFWTRNNGAVTAESTRADRLEEERFKFTLQEFVQIKQENLLSIQSMHNTLNFGLTAISLLFASVGQVWHNVIFCSGILMLVAPMLCILIERVWAAEVTRLARASYFLWRLELSLNDYFSKTEGFAAIIDDIFLAKTALHWEGWVRGHNRWGKSILMRNSYRSTLVFLLLIAAGSVGAGYARIVTAKSENYNMYVSVTGAVWLAMIVVYLLVEGYRTWSTITSYT